jgi:hypothetical protein
MLIHLTPAYEQWTYSSPEIYELPVPAPEDGRSNASACLLPTA